MGVEMQELSEEQMNALHNLTKIINTKANAIPSTPEGMICAPVICRYCFCEWITHCDPEDMSDVGCPRCFETGYASINRRKM